MYVLWDMSDDSIEGLCFVSRDLNEVRAYAGLPRSLWANADLRICELVDLTGDPPVQGCEEPPGMRFQCPNCGQTEYKDGSSEWRNFYPLRSVQLQDGRPAAPGLICHRCSTLHRVEFF